MGQHLASRHINAPRHVPDGAHGGPRLDYSLMSLQMFTNRCQADILTLGEAILRPAEYCPLMLGLLNEVLRLL